MSLRGLTLITLLLIPFVTGAQAFDWPWQRGKAKLKASAAAKSTPRVRITALTGATGESATRALRGELMNAGEVLPVGADETAGWTISGTSVGGRIVGTLRDAKGKELFERTYAAPGLDENAKALSDDLTFTITGRPGVATSQIAFVSDVSGQKQIYFCDSDGNNVRQVTGGARGSVAPALCESTMILACTTYEGGYPSLQLIDLGGGSKRSLADAPGGCTGAAISPDGQRIALTMSFVGTPEIFVTSLVDNTTICVSETTGVPCSPTWHPKQPLILYACDEGSGPRLWIATTVEGQAPRQWPTGYWFSTDPEWSPDGAQVAFTARVGESLGVVIKDYPSGRSRVIRAGDAQHPTWSPNGRFIAYAQGGNLMLHDTKHDEQRVLVKAFGNVSEPTWMK